LYFFLHPISRVLLSIASPISSQFHSKLIGFVFASLLFLIRFSTKLPRSLLVVVNHCFTKLPSVTELNTFDQTVDSRNSNLLLTLTALANHP
ncbi:hypothetical protein M8C21_008244, partial [Ambrosia artemisiifolia]